jgi:hypothetical protein
MTIRCHLLKCHPLPDWFQLIPSCREHMTSQYDRLYSLECDECDYVNSRYRPEPNRRIPFVENTQLSYL